MFKKYGTKMKGNGIGGGQNGGDEGGEGREDVVEREEGVCVCVWFYYTPFSAKPEESCI